MCLHYKCENNKSNHSLYLRLTELLFLMLCYAVETSKCIFPFLSLRPASTSGSKCKSVSSNWEGITRFAWINYIVVLLVHSECFMKFQENQLRMLFLFIGISKSRPLHVQFTVCRVSYCIHKCGLPLGFFEIRMKQKVILV